MELFITAAGLRGNTALKDEDVFTKAKKVRKDFLRSKNTLGKPVECEGVCQAGRLCRGEEGNELEWQGSAERRP